MEAWGQWRYIQVHILTLDGSMWIASQDKGSAKQLIQVWISPTVSLDVMQREKSLLLQDIKLSHPASSKSLY
jgi:hypothetical protein